MKTASLGVTPRIPPTPEESQTTTNGDTQTSSRCNCCPYGFHIDLDFVKYAEKIANGSSDEERFKRSRSECREFGGPLSDDQKSTADPRALSPLESLYSESIDNIVSDFDEMLNPTSRDYSSDREIFLRFRAAHLPSGYTSDRASPIVTRCLPPRPQSSAHIRGSYDEENVRKLRTQQMIPEKMCSSRKPPVAPSHNGHLPQQNYSTALGRTLLEMKARQKDQFRNESHRESRTASPSAPSSGYRNRSFGRPTDLGFQSPVEINQRSSYERGQTHFLGSKTPELGRRSFSTAPPLVEYDRRTSSIENGSALRQASNMLANGFASTRRSSRNDSRISRNNDLVHSTANQREINEGQLKMAENSSSNHQVLKSNSLADVVDLQNKNYKTTNFHDSSVRSNGIHHRSESIPRRGHCSVYPESTRRFYETSLQSNDINCESAPSVSRRGVERSFEVSRRNNEDAVKQERRRHKNNPTAIMKAYEDASEALRESVVNTSNLSQPRFTGSREKPAGIMKKSVDTSPVVHQHQSDMSNPSYSVDETIYRKQFPDQQRRNNCQEFDRSCKNCFSLQERLDALSSMLSELEDSKKSNDRSVVKSTENTCDMGNIGVNSTHIIMIDKGVDGMRPSTSDIASGTVPIAVSDFAGDPLRIITNHKKMGINHSDLVSSNWVKDMASSPPPQPEHRCIGVITDNDSVNAIKLIDAETETTLDVKYMIEHYQRLTDPKRTSHKATSTIKPGSNDRGCDAYNHTETKDTSTLANIPLLKETTDKCVGLEYNKSFTENGMVTDSVEFCFGETQTDHIKLRCVATNYDAISMQHNGTDAIVIDMHHIATSSDDLTDSLLSSMKSVEVQVDNELPVELENSETQTEFVEIDRCEPRVLNDSEIADSLWLLPSINVSHKAVGTDDIYDGELINGSLSNGGDKLYRIFINESQQSSTHTFNDDDDDSKLDVIPEVHSDPEALVFNESAEELSSDQHQSDATKRTDQNGEGHRVLGPIRAQMVKKMLTERSSVGEPNFIRGSAISRSCRVSSRKGDHLEYITEQHKNSQSESEPTTPSTKKGALKSKVMLKKESPPLLSRFPDPIPAKIPRPKISKYSPGEMTAESPDEEDEVADRLTPLRSEMRALRPWTNGRFQPSPTPPHLPRITPPATTSSSSNGTIYDNVAMEDDDSSSCSSDSEGSYDTNEANGAAEVMFEMSEPLREALDTLKKDTEEPGSVKTPELEWAVKFVQHEWLKTAARRTASSKQVEGFIDALEATSSKVFAKVANMTDQNENTALHYAVSHGNFDVVGVLLDSHVCNLDRANKAGYTPLMLAALCEINDEVEAAVVNRIFQMGNVNAKATQHGQTALMLAVSHGKVKTTRLLLECGADLNIQDEEGSTALMCAAEHGHKEIVKLLLAQPDIDASLSDCDSSTALSIAVENGHRDIGVLIYAHLNYGRSEPATSKESPKPVATPKVENTIE